MQLMNKEKYIAFVDSILPLLAKTNLNTSGFEELKDSMSSRELLIPIIGLFSAGKSTLLNTFLDQEILPVGLSPETELATELHFGSDEHILATTVNKHVERFSVRQFDDIKKRSQEFTHIKVFINNDKLKQLQPLILVDMPGFGSSLENHNKAINYYLPRGVHFLVVVSVEEGNITRSMTRQLNELESLDRDFSIVLSKTNLRSIDQVSELKEYIVDQMDILFDRKHQLALVGNTKANQFIELVYKINPDQIFESLYLKLLQANTSDVIDDINVEINALRNNSELNSEAISEISNTIENIERKRDDIIRNIEEQHSDRIIRNCIDYIGKELSSSTDELTNLLIKKNTDSFNSTIIEIIREGFAYKLQSEFKDITNDVVIRFSNELSDLNSAMSNFGMTSSWSKDFSDRLQQTFDVTGSMFEKIGSHLSSKSEVGKVYKTLSTVLAITTGVVAPVVEIVLIFLPEIIGFITSKVQEKKIHEAVQVEIIPKIKSELRRKIPPLVNEQLENIIKNIAESFDAQLQEKRVLILEREKERAEKVMNIDIEVTQLEEVRQAVTNLAENNLYK